jgi:hypothetical protein
MNLRTMARISVLKKRSDVTVFSFVDRSASTVDDSKIMFV